MRDCHIHLMGSSQPLRVSIEDDALEELLAGTVRRQWVGGIMSEPDGDGVCKRAAIATSRIECISEC